MTTQRTASPRHTAEEMAQKLREDISGCEIRIQRIEAERASNADACESEIEGRATPEEKAHARERWISFNERSALRIAEVRAQASVCRRLLQWFTGEIWS